MLSHREAPNVPLAYVKVAVEPPCRATTLTIPPVEKCGDRVTAKLSLFVVVLAGWKRRPAAVVVKVPVQRGEVDQTRS